MKTKIRGRHYSIRTETTYLDWVRRFIAFHGYANPKSIDAAAAVKEYLDYLAVERKVAASTQNQALNALVFFYNHALQRPFGEMETFVRAKRPQRLPEVMTRSEIQALFEQMEGVTALMAGLMYGAACGSWSVYVSGSRTLTSAATSGCLHHHDLHTCTEQAGHFGQKPG